MGKADYMQAYPLPERCLGGSLRGSDWVVVSSGSTGQPMFWPRSVAHELDVAVRFEQVFCDSFRADERVVCFALRHGRRRRARQRNAAEFLKGQGGTTKLRYSLDSSSAFLSLYSASVNMPLAFKSANFSIAPKISAS